jgi:XTP/dITP diphosphohydrolase
MNTKNLLMATMNLHKFEEVSHILQRHPAGRMYALKSLHDTGFQGEIPEEEDTLEGNASAKSWYVYRMTGMDCFSDDTGLEVEALGGAPGVYSARFAGSEANASDNIRKLLGMMEGETNRRAGFRTVVSLILDGREYFFEGVVEGEILHNTEGAGGFGYDPVFRPNGYLQSFGTLSPEEKNRISHRYEAIRRMLEYLKSVDGSR